eukprot:2681019-Rhodomonas_salina.1
MTESDAQSSEPQLRDREAECGYKSLIPLSSPSYPYQVPHILIKSLISILSSVPYAPAAGCAADGRGEVVRCVSMPPVTWLLWQVARLMDEVSTLELRQRTSQQDRSGSDTRAQIKCNSHMSGTNCG